MTQYKKDDVRQRIEEAALTTFSKKGYINTKISDIADSASISVGNIYRYYKTKDEIFYSVVPESFPEALLETVRNKINTVQGEVNSNAFEEVAGSFIRFMMLNRERIIIIFAGSSGTRYEGFKAGFADELVSAVKTFYSEKYAQHIERYGSADVIRLIFQNLISAYGYILSLDKGEDKTADMLAQLNMYHFSGITSLLGLQIDANLKS